MPWLEVIGVGIDSLLPHPVYLAAALQRQFVKFFHM
jgi:hypothetical protein